MTLLTELASNISITPKNLTGGLTKLPMELFKKFFFGLKAGTGGLAVFVGILFVVLVISGLLAFVGVDLRSLTLSARSEVGL